MPYIAMFCFPERNQFNIAIEHGPFIVDLPIKNGDFPQLCKRLPEDKFLMAFGFHRVHGHRPLSGDG